MSLLEHVHHTSAPPEAVWAVLEETARWPSWNTLTAEAPQGLVLAAPFHLGVALNNGRRLPVVATFVEVEPARRLVWYGGVRGLFTARHGFDLEPTGDGGTRIRHHETFTGLLHYPLLWALGDRQVRTYREVNEGLARAAEAHAAGL